MVVALLGIIFSLPATSMARPLHAGPITSTLPVSRAYTDSSGQIHYGAFFSGKEGYWQHYLGPGGDAATAYAGGGIANWNWWGTNFNVLLCPRTWLFFPNQAVKWLGSNYQANFQVIY
jgi:hypothetical protein